MTVYVEPVAVPADHHGEGPVWVDSAEALFWVDVFEAPSIQRFRPATGDFVSWPMPSSICSLAPRRNGGFVAATANGFCRVTPGESVDVLADPTAGQERELLNDGRCDAAGSASGVPPSI